MSKFKIGDKVKVIYQLPNSDGNLVGKEGNVIEVVNCLPWPYVVDIKYEDLDSTHWADNELELVKQVKEKKDMKKDNGKVVASMYIIEDKGDEIKYVETRDEARIVAKRLGGRKAGVRIIQQSTIRKEVR